MLRVRLSYWLVPSLCLSSIGPSPASGGTPQRAVVENLQLAGESLQIDEIGAFVVSESSHGHADRNGDGDPFDAVVAVFDPATLTVKNLGLAAPMIRVGGGLVIFGVPEAEQGAADLNGDGDLLDAVLHVYDAASDATHNLAVAGSAYGEFSTDGELAAMLVSESAQGNADRNGDGDTSDWVLAVFQRSSGLFVNTGLAGPTASSVPLVSNRRVVMLVSEGDQGGVDLNGDGDSFDRVVHVIDTQAGTFMNLGLAVFSGDRVRATQRLLAVMVREGSQGGLDLNGDGDAFDEVMFVHDFVTGVTTNLGVAAVSDFHAAGPVVAFRVGESSQGNLDLNGDGDHADAVIHAYFARSGVTANLGLAVPQYAIALTTEVLAFSVVEWQQGNTQLNGDGDLDDWVAHVTPLRPAGTVNLGLACGRSIAIAGTHVLCEVGESNQGGVDLNGDGDPSDGVLHAYRPGDGHARDLRLASSGSTFFAAATRTLGAFRVRESDQGGVDLNGDGDAMDFVLHLYRPEASAAVNAAIAANAVVAGPAGVLCTVYESEQGGADLNGDGDASDAVIHFVK